jgi:hypothetical protein
MWNLDYGSADLPLASGDDICVPLATSSDERNSASGHGTLIDFSPPASDNAEPSGVMPELLHTENSPRRTVMSHAWTSPHAELTTPERWLSGPLRRPQRWRRRFGLCGSYAYCKLANDGL